MTYELWDRLKVGDDYCIIKYIGVLPKWPTELSYGVEWDNPKRGKHSGTFDGKSYFETSVPDSGSFLKATTLEKIASTGVTFYQGLQEKYGYPSTHFDKTYMGSKIIEKVGFKELDNRNRDFKSLKRISLAGSLITDEVTILEVASIRENCIHVTELDLTNNLFSSFKKTCELLKNFKTLSSLDLSGNRFSKGWENLEECCFPGIKCLYLSTCNINIVQLREILKHFPSLEILDISWNDLSSLDHELVKLPNSMNELILSGNSISSLPAILSNCQIRSLNLSHNVIENIFCISAPKLENLDLSHNCIKDWNALDQVNINFPNLRSFRANNNPLYVNPDAKAQFYETIARFDRIDILDGSILSKDIRREAELFFISKIAKGEIAFNQSLRRWKLLSENCRFQNNLKPLDKCWLDSQILNIRVTKEDAHTSISIQVLSSYTIRYMKQIISNKLHLELLKIKLYYEITQNVFEELKHDFRSITDVGLCNDDIIYVKEGNILREDTRHERKMQVS